MKIIRVAANSFKGNNVTHSQGTTFIRLSLCLTVGMAVPRVYATDKNRICIAKNSRPLKRGRLFQMMQGTAKSIVDFSTRFTQSTSTGR